MTYADILLSQIQRRIHEVEGKLWSDVSDAFRKTQVEDRRAVHGAVQETIRKILDREPDTRLEDAASAILDAVGAMTCGPCEGLGSVHVSTGRSATCTECGGTGRPRGAR